MADASRRPPWSGPRSEPPRRRGRRRGCCGRGSTATWRRPASRRPPALSRPPPPGRCTGVGGARARAGRPWPLARGGGGAGTRPSRPTSGRGRHRRDGSAPGRRRHGRRPRAAGRPCARPARAARPGGGPLPRSGQGARVRRTSRRPGPAPWPRRGTARGRSPRTARPRSWSPRARGPCDATRPRNPTRRNGCGPTRLTVRRSRSRLLPVSASANAALTAISSPSAAAICEAVAVQPTKRSRPTQNKTSRCSCGQVDCVRELASRTCTSAVPGRPPDPWRGR